MNTRLFSRCLLAGLALVCAAPAARAQSGIAVLDATGVSILDTGNGQQLARFPLTLQPGDTPTAVAASGDGSRIFVTIRSSTSFTGALLVVDRDTGAVARFDTSASTPKGRAASTSDGKQVYFAATIKPPDGYSATYDNKCDVYKVDVEAGTLAAVSGSHTSGRCEEVLLGPNADRLYLSVTQALCCSGGGTADIVAFALGASGAARLWGDGTFPATVVNTALTADGSTLFGRFLWPGRSSSGLGVYDALSGSYVEHSVHFGAGPLAAASNTRVFTRGSTINGPRIVLFDTSTDTILGETPVYGTLISDTFAARTYSLEAARLSRLDNETAAATTVATGTGAGWIDGAILKDPCLSATLSQTIFTTNAASGTLTITAPGSCSWTIDPSTVPGLAFTMTSGSGPASLPFTLASATSPSIGTFKVGSRTLTIERVRPLMHIDEPGAVAQQPFLLRGWAIEASVNPATGAPPPPTVSAVHVWAWPMPSGAPTFVGIFPASGQRPDVAAAFGAAYPSAEFSVSVRGLPPGTYLIGVYAFSARLGTLTQEQGVTVSILPSLRVAIEEPGASVPRTFTVSGWAVDSGATTGPGVDAVHVWAFPDSGAAPVFVGAADYGRPRDDVAAIYGPSFRNSGYRLYGSLPPGRYTLQVFARSTVSGAFNAATAPLTVVADSTPAMNIDEPGNSSTITGPFQVRGWAIDRGAATGTGVDAFHIWAFPTDGSAPRFVGVGTPTTRPDIAAIVGPQFAESGFVLAGASLPPGSYTLAVFARSTVTTSFSVWRTVLITVQQP